MIELERSFLAKSVPDLSNCKRVEIIDVYLPKEKEHPVLRLRKFGNRYELTKKQPVEKDHSVQEEQTIELSEEEFKALSSLEGKWVKKVRYYLDVGRNKAEIDVFRGPLEGLVVVDFEFSTKEDKNSFKAPDFCLADVTQEEFIAGGMLCGKSYSDIERGLERFGYKKLLVRDGSCI